MRKRWLLLGALLVLFAAGAAVAAVVVWQQRNPGSIRGSASTEFVTTEEPGATTRPEEVVQEIPWPTYGYDDARTRFAPDFDLQPPYERLWRVRAGSLLEFPPVIAYGRLYVGTNNGRFLAIERETGEIAWERDYGLCMAAAPAVADGVVYQALMDPHPCRPHDEDSPGYIVALDAETGEELWRFEAGVNESSPLLRNGVLYFGTWDRKVYALDVETQRVRWEFETGDQVKHGPAFANGTIYIGSYDGKVYALDARTGRMRWEASGTGNFYATPTLAYGRVFIGNTDGRVYAYGARSGELLWARATGNYVYSSAAVWRRTVYAGSYDGHLYALDAATGDVRWRFDAGGPISGAPTILAGHVYFSILREGDGEAAGRRGRTFALDARTGERVWDFPDGKYTAVVADEERLYLVGYKLIYGLEPSG